MSLIVLDEHLAIDEVMAPLARHYSVTTIRKLRRTERILDDRIPAILLTLDRPTFLTIDQIFCDRRWCHEGYCILYFDLRSQEQDHVAPMTRALFKLREFATRSARMGKVVRITPRMIAYWQRRQTELHHVIWDPLSKRGK